MSEVICNTSPLQYLYQLGRLDLLPGLVKHVIVPEAVVAELQAGRAAGVPLPEVTRLDWIEVRRPVAALAEPLITDLGAGETEVLLLALELHEPVVILDDALARRAAENLGIRLIGTLGVLLNAKRAGFIPEILPELERLEALRFRLAASTRSAVLRLAGEA